MPSTPKWFFTESVQYGTYLGLDGRYHQGPHYHPFDSELAYPA